MLIEGNIFYSNMRDNTLNELRRKEDSILDYSKVELIHTFLLHCIIEVYIIKINF